MIPGLGTLRLAAVALVLVALAGSAFAAKHFYDLSHSLASRVAEQDRTLTSYAADAARYGAALTAAAEDARARSAATAALRWRISHAPRTTACAASPAVAAALDGLRGPGVATAAPAAAPGAAVVRGAAGASRAP